MSRKTNSMQNTSRGLWKQTETQHAPAELSQSLRRKHRKVTWTSIVQALLKSRGKLNISATLIHIKKKKYLCQIILGKHQVRFCAKARRKYKQFCNRNSSSDACQNMQLVQLEVVFISVFPSSCIQVIWCNIETEGCYHCTHGIVCTSKQHVRRKNTH